MIIKLVLNCTVSDIKKVFKSLKLNLVESTETHN